MGLASGSSTAYQQQDMMLAADIAEYTASALAAETAHNNDVDMMSVCTEQIDEGQSAASSYAAAKHHKIVINKAVLKLKKSRTAAATTKGKRLGNMTPVSQNSNRSNSIYKKNKAMRELAGAFDEDDDSSHFDADITFVPGSSTDLLIEGKSKESSKTRTGRPPLLSKMSTFTGIRR
jgi:hypothetical protein